MELIILEWTAVLLCVLGGVAIAKKQIIGFHITIVSDVMLMTYAGLTSQYGIFFLAATYLLINIYGIYYWHKNKKEE